MLKATQSYYYDFKFGNKYLSDFNAIIMNDNGWKIKNNVSINKVTEKINNKDGELFLGSDYSPRTITIPVHIHSDIDLDEFYSWLLNGEQYFEFRNSGRKIKAIFDNQIDIDAYLVNGELKAELFLDFIAYDPFWRNVNENIITPSTTLNTITNIKTSGNVECYPIIKVTPNGTQSKITFKINDDIITLSNVEREITINCESEEVTEVQLGEEINVFGKFYSTDYYEFPSLKPFVDNKFQITSGNASSVKIITNDRWI